MDMLYDTRTIHPLDRYDYYRAGAGMELAPVAVQGRSPGRLLAVMSVAQIGDVEVEVLTWSADSEIVARRTERLIRVCDPECYRIFLSVSGGLRVEHAGHQVDFRARDIALYDVSRPWHSTHLTGPGLMRAVMLTFPRALVPIASTRVRPLIGALIPRSMPGHSLIVQFLIGLTDTTELTGDPDLAPVLYECMVGLLRQRLGHPDGITPRTRQLLHRALIRDIIRRNLGNPMLDPNGIAEAAHISPRYLHQLFQGAELTPMQLLKRLRLQECNRRLQDPALAMTPIKDVIAAHGYLRPDQFARDFKQHFGISATQARRLANQHPTGREGRTMGLPSGGPPERLRLDPAAQDIGMRPTCEGHAGLPQLAGQRHPLTCRHRRPGNRQEELASAWFTSLTMTPTQRGGQLTPPTT